MSPLQFPSGTLDSAETAGWGVSPLEGFLFFEIKTINPAERMTIRAINWNPHKAKGFSLRVTSCVCIYIYIYIPLLESYPTSHLRVTPLATSISHCKNKYLGGLVGAKSVVCGVTKYVGCGDGVPQHASGGSEETARFWHLGWTFCLEVEFWCRGVNHRAL